MDGGFSCLQRRVPLWLLLMTALNIALVTLVGYVIGSLPFAVLIARAKGVDIFKVGSGNPGSTNVKRSVGKGAGNLCFALDFAKGAVAAGWPLLAFEGDPKATLGLGILGLMGAVIGHSYSVFLKFRGGKGVATSAGGVLVLFPLPWLAGAVAWPLLFYTTRYVSVASMAAAVVIALAQGVRWQQDPTEANWAGLLFLSALAVLVLARHKANIVRLLRGQEQRFSRKKD